MLTKEELNYYFKYDDGDLFWKNPTHPRIKKGAIVGWLNSEGYICMELFNKQYRVHNLIWQMLVGEIPKGLFIDHINNDRSDNHIENLRLSTKSQNGANSLKKRNTQNKLKGASYHKGQRRWNAQIQVDGIRYHIGSFNTEQEAHDAYCKVASDIFNEFLNTGTK